MPRAELVELHARGLGPIAEARLEFGPGFNVLTGETGAGKTLLVGALSLCVGESEARLQRDGEMRATAVFRVSGQEIALARESSAGGRLRGSIDGLVTSADGLRTRASELIVIHGQHDSLRLRGRAEALRLIDEFGGIDDSELRDARGQVHELEERRRRFGGDAATRAREIEFLKFQLADIDAVSPTSPDELTLAIEQLSELSALREHHEELVAALEDLDGDADGAVLTRWAAAVARIPDHGRFGVARERLRSLAAEARDLIYDLRVASDEVELDGESLSRLERRVGELQALARKYGGSLETVFATSAKLREELTGQEDAATSLETVDAQLAELAEETARLSANLRSQREAAARSFVEAVSAQFNRVALASAALEARVGAEDGSEIEFLFSANPGLAAGPLQSMASGGELSRVLLAISLETVSEGVVAVFDEVDAGVGGSVAQQIGECLAELASRQQVIVVTHLASVAARAGRHFVVDKVQGATSTETTVREVRGEERVSEIARMLAGESDLRESRALAERLLTGI